MHQQRRTQPVSKAVCLPVQSLPRTCRQKRRRPGKGIAGLGHAQRDGQDQHILCAGERHIQKAHLLAAGLLCVSIGKGGVCGGLVQVALFRTQPQACPVFPMQQHRLIGVTQVEVPGRIAHEHHRKLQALGAVDGHDGHAARACAARHCVLPGGACLCRRIDGTHQRRNAVCAGFRTERCKPAGILPAAGSVFQHAQCGKVAGGDKDLFQQLLCRNAAGHAPQLSQPGVKNLHLLGERCFIFALHHLQHCAVQAHAGVLCAGLLLFFLRFLAAGPQTHKVVVCKPEHRPQHGGSKIDVLRRVVDDL